MNLTYIIIANTASFVGRLFHMWERVISDLVADKVLCMHLVKKERYCHHCAEWRAFVSQESFRKIERIVDQDILQSIVEDAFTA